MATPGVAWAPAVEPAPQALNLRPAVAFVLANLSGDKGVPTFFDNLAALDPPIQTIEDVKGMLAREVRMQQKGVIATATLRTFARLIEPAGYVWNEGTAGGLDKRRPGGNGNNKATCTLEEQLAAEGVEALDYANFRWGDLVFNGVPKKGEAARLNGHESKLFDNTFMAMGKVRRHEACLPPRMPAARELPRMETGADSHLPDAPSQIKQLRAHLRPAAIRRATLQQWEEELAPWDPPDDKHGQPVGLMQKFEAYMARRRNSGKSLQRLCLLETDADALGLADAPELTVSLAKDRSLSSVVDLIKSEEVDPKLRGLAFERARWLRELDASSIVSVKTESTASTASTDAEGPGTIASGPLGTITPEQLSSLISTAVSEASKGSSPAPTAGFGHGARSKPRATSNLVPPSAPSGKGASQLGTTKAVPPRDKENAAKERSAAAHAATDASVDESTNLPDDVDSSDVPDDVDSSDDEAAAKRQKCAAAPTASRLATRGPLPHLAPRPRLTRSLTCAPILFSGTLNGKRVPRRSRPRRRRPPTTARSKRSSSRRSRRRRSL
eukprot:4292281-Prymnesium_polylepis.1